MTWWILLAVAGFFTLLASRRYEFVYTAIASLFWWGVWGYYTTTPPAGVTAGTFLYDLVYYSFIMVALGVFFLYFRNRKRVPVGYNRTAQEQAEYEREYKVASTKALPDDEAYRQQIRARILRGRANARARRR